MIEEPEAGLHHSAQRDLLLWLRLHTAQRNKQLIVATHSTLFSRPGDDVSVYLATYDPDASTQFRRIAPDEAPEVVQELGARLADLYAYDCLLLLEAESEVRGLPPILDALGLDFEFLGIRMVPLRGDTATRLQRLREYLEYMQGTQVIPFVMLDEDRGVRKATEDLISDGLLGEGHIWLWKRGAQSPGEFEDNFTDAQLIEAANNLASSGGSDRAPLDVSDLEALREHKPRTMTSKLLAELYFRRHQYGLQKPRLAEILGDMAAQDIKQGKRDYQIVAALERLQQVATTKGQPA